MLLPSNPIRDTEEDRLGRAPFARILARLVQSHGSDELIVLGIDGVWGAGKSSVLAMTSKELTADGMSRTATLSAWRNPSRDQFLANLTHSLNTALRRDWGDAYLRVAYARLTRQSLPMLVAVFLPLLTLTALIALPDVRGWTKGVLETDPKKLAEGAGLFAIPVLSYLFTKFSKPVFDGARSVLGGTGIEGAGSLERFAFDFDVLGAAQPRGSRFVVVVEDLDRCSPSHVTDVLSAIAQLSAHPRAGRLAFLLAYDREVVLKSIQADAVVHVDPSGRRQAAEDYLERVVHVEVSMPDVATSTGSRPSRRPPRLPTPVGALLASAAIVALLVALVASATIRVVAWWTFVVSLGILLGEAVIRRLMRNRFAVFEIPGWDAAVRAADPWLPSVPRSRSRVLNRARIALLLRQDVGLTAWEAVSTTMLAARWPSSFDPSTLKAVGTGTLDPRTAFSSREFLEVYDRMTGLGLSTTHFSDARKLHAIVSGQPHPVLA